MAGGRGSGRKRRQRPAMTAGAADSGSGGNWWRRKLTAAIAKTGGNSVRRCQRCWSTAAAETAVVGNSYSSYQRQWRRLWWRVASPGSTRLIPGWIPISRAKPSRGKRTKVETLEWHLKALLLCFQLSPYFWFPNSTLFHFLTFWPSYVRGKQKNRLCLAHPLLQRSYKTNVKNWSLVQSGNHMRKELL